MSAFFGVAAFNVGGTNLDSLLRLPVRRKRKPPLQTLALSKLQKDLSSVKYLIR